MAVHGYEEATEHEELLDERRFFYFYCSTISKIMSWDRFMTLIRCFCITNSATYIREKGLPGYEKLGQTTWLEDKFFKNCKRVWKLGKMCTIDEMMICYKRTYFLLR
jgi:hypothetical protein